MDGPSWTALPSVGSRKTGKCGFQESIVVFGRGGEGEYAMNGKVGCKRYTGRLGLVSVFEARSEQRQRFPTGEGEVEHL